MDLKQQVAKGLGWSFAQRFGTQLVNFILFLALARLLTPDAFGLVALATVFVDIVQLLTDQGFSNAIVQRSVLDDEHLDTAFWISLGLSVALSLVGILGSPTISHLLGETRLAPILAALCLGLPLAGLSSTQQAILQRSMDFRTLALRTLLAVVIAGSVGLGAALLRAGAWSLVARMLVGKLVGVVVLWRASEWRPSFRVSRSHLRELFTFGIHITGKKMLVILDTRLDNLLIGYFLGTTALGYYTIAYRVLTIVLDLMAATASNVLFPVFSQLQDKSGQLRQAFCSVIRYASALAFPAFSGLAVLAPQLVPVLFGPRWGPSACTVRILAFAGMVLGVTWFHGLLVISLGKPSWILLLRALLTAVRVVAFLYAVQIGLEAVALAYVVTSFAAAPAFVALVNRVLALDFRVYFRQYATPLVGSVFMVAVLYALEPAIIGLGSMPQIRLLLALLLGTTVYGVSTLVLEPTLVSDVLRLFAYVVPFRRTHRSAATE